MSSKDKRAKRRSSDTRKLNVELASQVAKLEGQLSSRNFRIERLEGDVVGAIANRDTTKAENTRLHEEIAPMKTHVAELEETIKRLLARIGSSIGDLGKAREERNRWRNRAREWEADAMETQKLRRRLEAKARAVSMAPLNRKAVTLGGGE